MTQNTPYQTEGELTVQHDLPLGTNRLVATWQLKAMHWEEENIEGDWDPVIHVYVHDVNESTIPHTDYRVEASMEFSDAPTAVQVAFYEQMQRVEALRSELGHIPVDEPDEDEPEEADSVEDLLDDGQEDPNDHQRCDNCGGVGCEECGNDETATVDAAVQSTEDDDA
jgi:hypothetical protein